MSLKYDPQAGVTKLQRMRQGRRSTGRFPVEEVRCSLGKVIDLSAGGLSVLCKHVPDRPMQMRIGSDTVEEFLVVAEPVWSRRVGLFKKVAGFRFLDVDEATRSKLNMLRSCCSEAVIGVDRTKDQHSGHGRGRESA